MDYINAFEISLSGMAAEKSRLDTVALNIANMNSPIKPGQRGFQPLDVVLAQKSASLLFSSYLERLGGNTAQGVEIKEIVARDVDPRLVYEPGHPYADETGHVAYPNVNPASEMVKMMESMRSYEANISAFNASKTMAMKALEIGNTK